MSGRTTRVKVKRSELIRVVEGRLRKAEAAHKREVESYPQRLEEWRERATDALRKALAAAERGKLPQTVYGEDLRVRVGPQPVKPSAGRHLCDLERTLKTLKIGAEDTVLLNTADADAYFGPCEV